MFLRNGILNPKGVWNVASRGFKTNTNAHALQRAFCWVFSFARWSKLVFRPHAQWTPETLAAVATMIPCNDRENITDAFEESRDIVASWGIGSIAKSFQGFFKQLIGHAKVLKDIVIKALRENMLELLRELALEEDFLLFAVDGSRVAMPRTKSNQDRFCSKRQNRKSKKKTTKKKGKKKTQSQQKKADSPQAWITVLYNLTLGLPWDFRTGPSGSSERDHLRDMIPSLPQNALVTADAGFVGYDSWSALNQAGIAFVIRVGANVKLLKQLGVVRTSGNIVHLWPDKQQKKHQPPLTLRLVTLRDGDECVSLVTNVLDEEKLSEARLISIYKERWQIELYYRTFKQTFGKRKLRCASASNAEQELTWSVIGLWMTMLYAADQRVRARESLNAMSPAGVIKAFRETIRQWPSVPARDKDLDTLIQAAQKDSYIRTSEKTNKDYPRQKTKKKLGTPIIQQATQEQRTLARKLSITQCL